MARATRTIKGPRARLKFKFGGKPDETKGIIEKVISWILRGVSFKGSVTLKGRDVEETIEAEDLQAFKQEWLGDAARESVENALADEASKVEEKRMKPERSDQSLLPASPAEQLDRAKEVRDLIAELAASGYTVKIEECQPHSETVRLEKLVIEQKLLEKHGDNPDQDVLLKFLKESGATARITMEILKERSQRSHE